MIYRKVLFIESCSSFVHIATQSDQAAGLVVKKRITVSRQAGIERLVKFAGPVYETLDILGEEIGIV